MKEKWLIYERGYDCFYPYEKVNSKEELVDLLIKLDIGYEFSGGDDFVKSLIMNNSKTYYEFNDILVINDKVRNNNPYVDYLMSKKYYHGKDF